MKQKPAVHNRLYHSLLYGAFHHFFMGMIILYALFLSLQGIFLENITYDFFKKIADYTLIICLLVELGLKLIVAPKHFFSYRWNTLDLLILISAFLMPSLLLLRVFRFFIYVYTFFDRPFVNRVIHTFLISLPTLMVSATVLIASMFCYALLATDIFGEDFPHLFGHVGRSMFTFAQIITYDDWIASVVRPVMGKYPYSWIIFFSFVIFIVFGILNIFIGTIVNAMNAIDNSQSDDTSIADLEQQIQELKKIILENTSSK